MVQALAMTMLTKCITYLVTSLLLCSALNAQIIKPAELNEHDTELWTGIGIGHKINKRWNVGLDFSYRTNSNIQQFKSAFSQLDAEYRYKKDFRFSAALRYIYRGVNQHSIRPLANFSYVHKLDKINIKNRLRYQQDFKDLQDGEMLAPDLDFYLRNKLSVIFKKVDHIEPLVFGEIFYRVYYKGNDFDQLRIGIGFSRELTKRQELSIAYVYREEFNVANPLQSNVINIALDFELKNLPKFKNL